MEFSTCDKYGGAFNAIYRLHRAFIKEGVSSTLFVLRKYTRDPTVKTVYKDFAVKLMSYYLLPGLNKIAIKSAKRFYSTNFFSFKFHHYFNALEDADIIILYWVSNFLSIKWIGRILDLGKPVIWRLSDMWPFTGGCHYSGRCEGYRYNCSNCVYVRGKLGIKVPNIVWKLKKKYWRNLGDLILVCPSRWIAELARASSLLGKCRIEIIPSGVDLKIFRPIDKHTARKILALPQNKKLILCGAVNPLKDPRKGGRYLIGALKEMAEVVSNREGIEIIFFGTRETVSDLPFISRAMGYISDDHTLALLYSACDVFVAPYVEDNLPNTVIESIACGTPVVAFRTGGVPEIINHGENGYLAEPFDVEDLTNGINWVLSNPEYDKLSRNAREKAVENFDLKKIASRYIETFQHLLKGRALG